MITKSEILFDRVQPPGYRKVTEYHQRDNGPDIFVRYLADNKDDVNARMLARVPDLETQRQKELDDEKNLKLDESIAQKIDVYLTAHSDGDLAAKVALTLDEITRLKELQ